MPRNTGYVDPLLVGLAVDYSVKASEGLIGKLIFPTVKVSKPSGEYYTFTKEQAYKVEDDTFAENGEARRINRKGTKTAYSTTPRGNKEFINKGDVSFMEGPFVKAEVDYVKEIIDNIEKNKERRIRDIVLGLAGRSASLTGTGSAKTAKWANGGGDPYNAILDAIKALFYRPNLMVVPESVFDVLEYHPVLIAKLGEANMIKKVSEDTLAKLFRINQVTISSGKADFTKQKKDESVNPTAIWGNSMLFAYQDSRINVPSAGNTFMVNYAEANGEGYVVRKWDIDDKGVLGGREIQVACDMDEHVVSEDLIYSIQDCL